MKKLLNLITAEPVIAAFTAWVVVLLGLLVAFGVHLTDIQKAAIVAFITASIGIAVAVRKAVTPTKTVEADYTPNELVRARKKPVTTKTTKSSSKSK